ncbi:TetR/AcrR family transcriptional regulator [Microbacterium sp. NPDC055910]|uniref:TetR/AcrR family transcriptional regulator n=1 Tax=Microbacterium sp. NPDC055910 TaxID=3345659 RepID=UPI0035E35B3A
MAGRTKSTEGAAERKGGAREGRRFDRYEILIDTAADLFRTNGYDATSLQQIADKVGILKGSLYYYIDTKEDLLFAIIQRNHERIIQGNSEWRSITDDPLAAIRSFVEGHMRCTMGNVTYSEVFIRDFRSLSEVHSKEIRHAQEEYDHEFRALIRVAADAGLLRDGVEPSFASRAIFGMSNWIFYWFRPGGELTREDVVAKMSEYAMASLR